VVERPAAERLRVDRPYVEIPLLCRDGSVRAVALVDADDYPLVSRYRWSVGGNGGYVLRYYRLNGRKTSESMGRAAAEWRAEHMPFSAEAA
jgi:hypothetical protein